MGFPKSVTDKAWSNAGGKCECTRTICGHKGRCNKPLTEKKWHAHHKTSVSAGGGDTLSNCEALCVPCHENTRSYGG